MRQLVLIVLAFCAFQSTSAQKQYKGKKGMNMSAEDIATLQTKKLTLALDLNKAQQDDIYVINLENAKLRKTQLAERKAKRESGEATKPNKEERVAMMNKMLDHRIAVKEKMKNILNEEQYNRWEKIMAKRHAKMKHKIKDKKASRKA